MKGFVLLRNHKASAVQLPIVYPLNQGQAWGRKDGESRFLLNSLHLKSWRASSAPKRELPRCNRQQAQDWTYQRGCIISISSFSSWTSSESKSSGVELCRYMSGNSLSGQRPPGRLTWLDDYGRHGQRRTRQDRPMTNRTATRSSAKPWHVKL